MIQNSVRNVKSQNSLGHVTLLHVISPGSVLSGLSVQLFVEKAFKIESLYAENWKVVLFKKQKRVIVLLMKNQQAKENVTGLKNARLNGLLVHGPNAQNNAAVVSELAKLYA